MTKLVVALSLALLSASFVGAADITLKDGRVLRDAVVVRDDAATVTFRHAKGFTQVEKAKLPEALAAEYPLDATEAKLEAERQQREILARRAEAERLLALRVQLAAAAPKPVETPASVEPKEDTRSSPTTTHSWVDTYNYESWRLMRSRARQDEYDRDHERFRDFGRFSDYSRDLNHGREPHRDRDRDCSPPPTAPRLEIRVMRDTPAPSDSKMVTFDPTKSSDDPSDADKTQAPPRFYRF